MLTLRFLVAILCVAAAGPLQAQILTVNVIDRQTSEVIEPDSLRIEIPSRSIDTVITSGRFTDWDPTVSVWEGASQSAEYSWDGATISGSGFEPYSHVSILLCDVLGRTIEQLEVTTFYNGSFRTVPATSPPALTFIRVTDGYHVIAGRLALSRRSQQRTSASPHREGRIADVEQIYVTAYRRMYHTKRDSIAYDADSLLTMTIVLEDTLIVNDVRWLKANVTAKGIVYRDGQSATATVVKAEVAWPYSPLDRTAFCSIAPSDSGFGAVEDVARICADSTDPSQIRVYLKVADRRDGTFLKSVSAIGRPLVEPTEQPGWYTLTFRGPDCQGLYSETNMPSGHPHSATSTSYVVKELLDEEDYIIITIRLY